MAYVDIDVKNTDKGVSITVIVPSDKNITVNTEQQDNDNERTNNG